MVKRIIEICSYKEMIRNLVRREIRGKYQKSVLGMLWTLINPLFQVLVFTLVFTLVFKSDIENYSVHLIVALIPWTFFSDSANSGVSAIVSNSNLVKKIYFPREVLVISSVTAKFVNLIYSLIVVFLFVVIFQIPLNPLALLFLPIVMMIEYILVLGIVLLLSSICVYFRDMEHITSIIVQAWVWLTPVMYSIDFVKGILLYIVNINPLTKIILAYRDILYYSQIPNVSNLIMSFVVALLFLIIGEVVFMKLEPNFAEEL